MSKAARILIAGAGPVGLTAAIELARRGFSPRIIDKATGPAGESRAFGIHARTLEIFEPAGITAALLDAGHCAYRAVICDDDGEFMRLNFTHARQKYNFVLVLPQSKTEQILLDALGRLGITVQWNTALDEFQQVGDKVHCVIAGQPCQQPYHFLIGCDGARSTVRESLGIGFMGESYEHDWQLMDVRFTDERPMDEVRVKVIRGNVLASFPFEPNAARFVHSGPGLLEAVVKEVDIEEVLWQSDFRISHRMVESYHRDNVFLAGDAAHVHSPVGGRGMNLGIEDAATLAWLIDMGRTDQYTRLRKPIGRQVLRFTDAQTKQITSTNPVTRFLIRRVGPLIMKSIAIQRFAFRRLSGANTPRPPWL